MSYRTLAELETDIRYRYDLEGFTARHPQAQIFRLINEAYRSLRDRLTSEGSTIFVTTTEFTASTPGRTSGYPGTLLVTGASPGYVTVFGVHYLDGQSWYPLRHAQPDEALVDYDDSTTGRPDTWSVAGVDIEGGGSSSGQATRILVSPPLDVARTFRVHGVKGWTDLTTTTDRIYTDLGFAEYVIASVGVSVAMRDDDAVLYQARAAEKELAYRDAKKRSMRRDPTPMSRVDVRGRRL